MKPSKPFRLNLNFGDLASIQFSMRFGPGQKLPVLKRLKAAPEKTTVLESGDRVPASQDRISIAGNQNTIYAGQQTVISRDTTSRTTQNGDQLANVRQVETTEALDALKSMESLIARFMPSASGDSASFLKAQATAAIEMAREPSPDKEAIAHKVGIFLHFILKNSKRLLQAGEYAAAFNELKTFAETIAGWCGEAGKCILEQLAHFPKAVSEVTDLLGSMIC